LDLPSILARRPNMEIIMLTANLTHEVGALPAEDAKVSGESKVDSYSKARGTDASP